MGRRRADRSPGMPGWLGQVLAWLVISAAVALIAIAVVIPRVGGGTPYTVLTGSMRPGMPPGTMVVVRPIDPDDITIGTVVTYQLESGKPTVVTHRVVGIGFTADGKRAFTTQGDANNAADSEPVREVQIRGARWYSVPVVGRITRLVTDRQRELATTIIAVGLLGYAAAMFAGALRERHPSKQKEEVQG